MALVGLLLWSPQLQVPVAKVLLIQKFDRTFKSERFITKTISEERTHFEGKHSSLILDRKGNLIFYLSSANDGNAINAVEKHLEEGQVRSWANNVANAMFPSNKLTYILAKKNPNQSGPSKPKHRSGIEGCWFVRYEELREGVGAYTNGNYLVMALDPCSENLVYLQARFDAEYVPVKQKKTGDEIVAMIRKQSLIDPSLKNIVIVKKSLAWIPGGQLGFNDRKLRLCWLIESKKTTLCFDAGTGKQLDMRLSRAG